MMGDGTSKGGTPGDRSRRGLLKGDVAARQGDQAGGQIGGGGPGDGQLCQIVFQGRPESGGMDPALEDFQIPMAQGRQFRLRQDFGQEGVPLRYPLPVPVGQLQQFGVDEPFDFALDIGFEAPG